jgi:hypothetical protein
MSWACLLVVTTALVFDGAPPEVSPQGAVKKRGRYVDENDAAESLHRLTDLRHRVLNEIVDTLRDDVRLRKDPKSLEAMLKLAAEWRLDKDVDAVSEYLDFSRNIRWGNAETLGPQQQFPAIDALWKIGRPAATGDIPAVNGIIKALSAKPRTNAFIQNAKWALEGLVERRMAVDFILDALVSEVDETRRDNLYRVTDFLKRCKEAETGRRTAP